MICNLNQNPKSRPIANRFLPTLLKAGVMWLLSSDHADSVEERALTGSVAWLKIGVNRCPCSQTYVQCSLVKLVSDSGTPLLNGMPALSQCAEGWEPDQTPHVWSICAFRSAKEETCGKCALLSSGALLIQHCSHHV